MATSLLCRTLSAEAGRKASNGHGVISRAKEAEKGIISTQVCPWGSSPSRTLVQLEFLSALSKETLSVAVRVPPDGSQAHATFKPLAWTAGGEALPVAPERLRGGGMHIMTIGATGTSALCIHVALSAQRQREDEEEELGSNVVSVLLADRGKHALPVGCSRLARIRRLLAVQTCCVSWAVLGSRALPGT